MIWENFSGPGIYKVYIRYSGTHPDFKRIASGHNIIAESPEDALRIAKQYKIGNPFGRDDIKERSIDLKWENNQECLQTRGGIWAEENGKLVNIRERLEKDKSIEGEEKEQGK